VSKPHEWVGATVMMLDTRLATQAVTNGKLTITSRVTIDVLDVYCRRCRMPYAVTVNGSPCQIGPQHIGGPRKQPELLPVDSEWPDPHDPLA